MRCRFGKGFKNGIAGWCFSENDLERVYRRPSDLLMLDMEFGVNCSLNCGYCFRKDDHREDARIAYDPLSEEDVYEIVDQAKKMHSKSIHFVGKGEPLEEKGFLRIVRYISKKQMIPLVFTAGHVLGDDRLAKYIHGMKGTEIVKYLYDQNASIILKINSLNHVIQDAEVNAPKIKYENGKTYDFHYTQARENALERLMEAGFNSTKHNPTRLGTATVMLKSNYYELFHHYRYFRSLNIYPIINTVVPCGRTHDFSKVAAISPTREEKLELWKKIYEFNVRNGIRYEGVSSYVGGHVCSQLGYAMYVNVFGEVFDCPSSPNHLGDVKVDGVAAKTLSEMWEKSGCRKKYRNCRDNGCPWRFENPSMIPQTLFKEVHEHLKETFPDREDIKNFVAPEYYEN